MLGEDWGDLTNGLWQKISKQQGEVGWTFMNHLLLSNSSVSKGILIIYWYMIKPNNFCLLSSVVLGDFLRLSHLKL